ncbi:glycoside hydrolase family 2 protein [Fimbriimonas ginsengisoli]|uniref:Glycoside hydrolase family 2 protein n=1 Tax=Fimbriimonas ginsengisoli Gsoil 348 TaxID=661478 RepID=A0A068NPB9_FIMGI|nr:glycoside hydrolase family 2 TIM barrel-domain containing protein [Fimbriimonas ginsengisoli]AIE85301.1 glycoside hydrolase family 2 protein [Fimbriimonas ginsengisoli Gsoil 348]
MRAVAVGLLISGLLVCAGAQTGGLKTRWAAKVGEIPLPEYPRPTMVRPNWTNLNGRWEFAMTKGGAAPRVFPEKIRVPFPVESQLSGINRMVPAGSMVWYRRSFAAPKGGGRTLIHFGAVDWSSEVRVNGVSLATHQGGYDAFTVDATDALKGSGPQELLVGVSDPTDAGTQPRGKQVRRPGGIFYTPTTGIWQTVWLEQVPPRSFDHLKIDTWPRAGQVEISQSIRGDEHGCRVRAEVLSHGRVVARSEAGASGTNTLKVASAKWWSPDAPNLYDVRLTLLDEKGRRIDQVKSYFGFREVSVGPGPDGKTRILLNGKPTFMVGPLDQGFWPDGLYTAPTDDALKYDLDVTKRLGFNMIRKHVKVEPERWYTWCDRMGILVWQDMPSGDGSIGPNDPDLQRSLFSASIFERELDAMLRGLHNHPSIVTWVVFNEGWGQYDTARMAQKVKDADPSRIVDSVTGWADRGVGDMNDWHVYPGPGSPKPEAKRAAVLGEFGGLGLPTPGHMWQATGWGYRSFKTPGELTAAFEGIFSNLHLLIGDPGLSAAVYTQTTDVETELNGLMTYDRAVIKMDPARVRRAVTSLFGPVPAVTTVLPTSESTAYRWRYTESAPPSGWQGSTFDESHWLEGLGGFGTKETPGAIVGTEWRGKDIWLRRWFDVSGRIQDGLALRIHHDDQAEVYLDGELISTLPGWTSAYSLVTLPKVKLNPGHHILAIHCHQDAGGQFIDAGLVRIK